MNATTNANLNLCTNKNETLNGIFEFAYEFECGWHFEFECGWDCDYDDDNDDDDDARRKI